MHAFVDDEDKKQVQYGDMDATSFSRYGHHLMDWIVNYFAHVADTYPTMSRVTPDDIRRSLPEQAPDEAESMEAILDDIYRVLLPGITHWNSPGFMGHFGLSSSSPNVLAEMLDATLNVTRMQWDSSPAATELEQVTLNWFREMLGLPVHMSGVLLHSSPFVHALLAAREAIPHLDIARYGLAGRNGVPALRVYASQEAHPSLAKAAMVTGIGLRGLHKVETDDQLRMDMDALERAMEQDLRAGSLPFAVVATLGTNVSTSVDPVARIARLCRQYGIWLHVDAAYGGAAAVLPEKRWILDGCEHADSFSVDPHTWLFTSPGSSAFYMRHPELLKSALHGTSPDGEAGNDSSDDEFNLMDYTYDVPQRFPALKLWVVMRYFGREGLEARIAEQCRLAQWLAEQLDASPTFERMADVPLSVVCLRAHPIWMYDEAVLDALNESIMLRINTGGHYYLSHARLRGKYVLRVAIGHLCTAEDQVRALWHELQLAMRVELGLLEQRKLNHTAGPGIIRMLNLPYRAR